MVGRVPHPPSWHEEFFSVGVTGTNGKTTTTSWIASALRAFGTPVARATTVGFFISEKDKEQKLDLEESYEGFLSGMSACRARGGRHAAIELTSEALSAGFARAWPCNVGVFTNLTHDHLDAHGSLEHYLASKAQLFVSLPENGTAVLNASDPVFDLLREVIPPKVHVRSYAVSSRGSARRTPDVIARSIDVSWSGTRIECEWRDGGPEQIRIRAVGEIFAENALAAFLGATAAGVKPEDVVAALATAASPNGRFELVHERPWIVVDYAHSPDALERTVRTARLLAKNGRLFVVFGAGGQRDKAKRAPMGRAARSADVVILTSDNPRNEDPNDIAAQIREGLSGHSETRIEIDRRRAIEIAITEAKADDVILIAGKGHEAVQIVGSETRAFSDVLVVRHIQRLLSR